MKDSDLTRMANQIAANFAAYSRDEAVEQTRTHIRSFWDPRMRRQIIDYIARGGMDLDPVAKDAIAGLDAPATART